jgi:hypothetical protein
MISDSKIKTVQDKIKKALAKIEKDENISIGFGSCSYNAAFYTTKMTVRSKVESVEVSKAYEIMCKRLGFTQNIIGMEFPGNGGQYKIVEIKLKNRKYPVIAKSANDKLYKYSVADIKRRIGGDQIINRNANLDKLVGK